MHAIGPTCFTYINMYFHRVRKKKREEKWQSNVNCDGKEEARLRERTKETHDENGNW